MEVLRFIFLHQCKSEIAKIKTNLPTRALTDFVLPVSVIVQEIAVIPGVEHGLQEQSKHLHAANTAEAPVGCMNAPAHNPEFPVRNFLAQQIIFRKECTLVEAAQAVEGFPVKQHKHSRAEWP